MLFFVLNGNKLSSHMAHISEHINFSNQNIPSYDKMIRIIVNLGIRTVKNNDNSSLQHTHLNKSLLMSIIDTLENYLSNVDIKFDMRKVRTSSINLLSIVFLFNKCNVSPNVGARVGNIVAMKFSKTMDHTTIFDAVAYGNKKLIPILFFTIGSVIIILVGLHMWIVQKY